MSTALESLVSISFLDNSGGGGAIAYTVPTGKVAEIFIQRVRAEFNDSGNTYGYLKVGEAEFPRASDPGGANATLNIYSTDLPQAPNPTGPNQVGTMGRKPILLDQGQTIRHLSTGFSDQSQVVAVIKLYNRPS